MNQPSDDLNENGLTELGQLAKDTAIELGNEESGYEVSNWNEIAQAIANRYIRTQPTQSPVAKGLYRGCKLALDIILETAFKGLATHQYLKEITAAYEQSAPIEEKK